MRDADLLHFAEIRRVQNGWVVRDKGGYSGDMGREWVFTDAGQLAFWIAKLDDAKVVERR